jgi:hypothetical protein
MDENQTESPSTDATTTTQAVKTDAPKTAEVSAATVGRMMGLATTSDLRLMDSKLDLISTKVAGLTVKLDKILTTLNSMPTAADLERIDVQIGSVKTSLRETVQAIKDAVTDATGAKI